ncbi:hypothetical protein [Solibacillus sp. FSL H8-0538]|uniref:hypothetical protein n=1 Tax=Solibacillus sp. FSL H8-0538 TaxID=2921400 RepID=UPI0030FBE339
MNLDERLAKISRIERTTREEQLLYGNLAHSENRKKRTQLWTYRIVLAAAMVVILFFIKDLYTQTSQSEQSASATSEIEKMTVLYNLKPNNHLNLQSVFYTAKRSTTEEGYIKAITSVLAKADVEPWNEPLVDSYGVYDILANYENGQTSYLKLSTAGSTAYLLDVDANVRYPLTNKQTLKMNKIILDISHLKKDQSWKLTAFIILGIILVLNYFFIERKQVVRDEQGNKYTRPFLTNLFFTSIFIVPLVWMDSIIGAKHLGIIVLVLIISLTLGEHYDIQSGVKTASWRRFSITIVTVVVAFVIMII